MKLIVGLGNIGENYAMTRHNAGFIALDEAIGFLNKKAKFSMIKKYEAEVAKMDGLVLLKPMTFMNNSGRSVRKMMDFYKLNVSDVIVVHDDLDIRLGEYKIQKGTGPKVHNGLNSVEKCLGDKDFYRVRIGVDNREKGILYGSGADYVLGKFSKDEFKILDEVVKKVVTDLLALSNG